MTWCRTPMMPWVAAVKSGFAAELLETVDGQTWSTSNKTLPLSLTCRQTGGQRTNNVRSDRQACIMDRQAGEWQSDRYLCVAGSDLLIQLLVFLDSGFQLCCSRWQ